MPRNLPLELQHYILELALPSTKLFTGPERRRLFRTFSLVHRSWTPVAQRLLFQQVAVKKTTFASGEVSPADLAELTLSKATRITHLEIDTRHSLLLGFLVLPLAEDWPESLRSLTAAKQGSALSLRLNLDFFLPGTLTRLFLSTIQTLVHLPPLPNLETLLLARTTVLPSGLKCDVLFPSLCVFAWDNVSSPPSLFVLPTFPPATKHMRLNLTKEWPLSDALELMDDLPIGLSSLDIHLVPLTLKALLEAVEGRLSWTKTTRVRFTTMDETQEDIELWEARL
ncbi:hypothetical protein JCM6882_005201 [Rhodosporidiobolus microsporus]